MAHNTLKTRLGLAVLGLISCASSALATTYTYRQPANGVVAASAPAPVAPQVIPAVAQFLTGGSPLTTSLSLGAAFSRTSSPDYATALLSQTVTVKNNGNPGAEALTVGTPNVGAPYTLANNNCPATLAAGASCTFDVVLVPLSSGNLSQPLALTTSAGNLTATVSATVTDAFQASTSLLMHFDNNVLDVKGSTVTNTGAVFTTTSAFSGHSITAPSGGNRFTIPSTAHVSGTGDFTYEMWMRPTAYPANYGLVFAPQTNGGLASVLTSTGKLSIGRSQIASDYTSTGSVPLNQWSHIAYVRKNSVFTIYINGVVAGTYTTANSYTAGATNFFVDGNGSSFPLTTVALDELRITKGVARYTAPFTPPAAPFAD